MSPEDVLKRYETQINLHDFAAVAPLIADDATFWFSDGTHVGHDAIRAAFEKTWALIRKEHYWLEDLQWIARGDAAASCTYTFHWKGLIDGQALAGKGRGTTVLRRTADGWKIAHEHLSRFPA